MDKIIDWIAKKYKLRVLSHDNCTYHFDGKADFCMAGYGGGASDVFKPEDEKIKNVGEDILKTYNDNPTESEKLRRLLSGEIESGRRRGGRGEPVFIGFNQGRRLTYFMACHVEGDGVHIRIPAASRLGGS